MRHSPCRKYQHGDLKTIQGLMLELGYCVELTQLSINIHEIYKNAVSFLLLKKMEKSQEVSVFLWMPDWQKVYMRKS
jgi:hypothetical protein